MIASDASPPIDVLEAIRPSLASAEQTRLAYPALAASVALHAPFQAARLARLQAASPGTLAYATALHEVRRFAFIRTALDLQTATPSAQQKLSDEYTQLAIDLFGTPKLAIAWPLLTDELAAVKQMFVLPHVDRVVGERLVTFYHEQLAGLDLAIADSPAGRQLPDIAVLVTQTRTYFLKQYGDVLDAVVAGDAYADVVGPHEILKRFRTGLQKLQATYPGWDKWRVVVGLGNALEVKSKDRLIIIGEHRPPMALHALQALFGHEVLVHALRSVQATLRGDIQAAAGLPGYIVTEEGLGCLVEEALAGRASEKMHDRYLDVAFALGLFNGKPLARQQLFEVAFARLRLRAQAHDEHVSLEALQSRAHQQTNRVYRGSLGNDIVGVCTKDSAYYNGFQAVTSYIIQALHSATLPEIYTYLFAGKFDPLKPAHVAYMLHNGIRLGNCDLPGANIDQIALL